MIKKFLAAAAALVMCFTMVSCGDSDTSGKDSEDSAATPWGQTADSKDSSEESKAEESKAEESKAEESEAEGSKAEESKPADTEAPESKAEVIVTEESKPDSSVPEAADPAESKEETVSLSEVAPSAGSFTVTGTGYTVSFGEGWTDMNQYKDQVGQMSADAAKEKFGIDSSSFAGMDTVCMYTAASGTNPPVFNVVAPVVNAAFKSVTISQLETVIVASIEKQMDGINGFKCENKGIKKYNGVDFLELYTEYDLGTMTAKARQFFALQGDKEYVISFSISGDMYDSMLDETEKVIKTFKFTEE